MFDFTEYIKLANTLNKNTDEASKRSAVSRAYYGALMHTKKYLIENDKKIDSSENSHEAIWYTLQKLGKKEEIIANMGFALKNKRKNADYESKIKENIHSWSMHAIFNANAIVNQINALKKSNSPKKK